MEHSLVNYTKCYYRWLKRDPSVLKNVTAGPIDGSTAPIAHGPTEASLIDSSTNNESVVRVHTRRCRLLKEIDTLPADFSAFSSLVHTEVKDIKLIEKSKDTTSIESRGFMYFKTAIDENESQKMKKKNLPWKGQHASGSGDLKKETIALFEFIHNLHVANE
eukprot:Trichotokara_eunicae@DN3410_c0_g1_i2.p1